MLDTADDNQLTAAIHHHIPYTQRHMLDTADDNQLTAAIHHHIPYTQRHMLDTADDCHSHCIISTLDRLSSLVTLRGIVVNALAFGPRGPGSAPQPCHYSAGYQPWASCLLTLPPQSSQLQETEAQ